MNIDKPEDVLREVLRVYSQNPAKDATKLSSTLVHEKFDSFSLTSIDVSKFAFNDSDVVTVDDMATAIVLYDGRDPHLAVLRRQNSKWLLKAFLFQCTACYSLGIIYDNLICPSCGGTGWGTLGDLQFC